jgi:putative transposase
VDYCYFNPVKHGLVERVRDWPFSTYHRDVRAGLFEEDWTIEGKASGAFGERPEGSGTTCRAE